MTTSMNEECTHHWRPPETSRDGLPVNGSYPYECASCGATSTRPLVPALRSPSGRPWSSGEAREAGASGNASRRRNQAAKASPAKLEATE